MRSIYNDNDITIGGGMLFQTSDETSTLTRPWDRFLKIVIFLSLEDTLFYKQFSNSDKKEKTNSTPLNIAQSKVSQRGLNVG